MWFKKKEKINNEVQTESTTKTESEQNAQECIKVGLGAEDSSKGVLDSLITVVESRNVESGSHIIRVRNIVSIMLTELSSKYPEYNISPKMINLYSEAATLHDIGKIAIPDSILNKPGRLTEEEYEIMKTHSAEGAKIVDSFVIDGQDELLDCCKDIALHHHERFDGNGYPDGLVGDENNICVQVMGVADAYDALVSKRCYKNSYSHGTAIEMIKNGECGVFNPDVIAALLSCQDRIRAVYSLVIEDPEN